VASIPFAEVQYNLVLKDTHFVIVFECQRHKMFIVHMFCYSQLTRYLVIKTQWKRQLQMGSACTKYHHTQVSLCMTFTVVELAIQRIVTQFVSIVLRLVTLATILNLLDTTGTDQFVKLIEMCERVVSYVMLLNSYNVFVGFSVTVELEH
jgi:hypothetical protein